MMNSAIGAGNEEHPSRQSLLPTEKRKHAKVGDESKPIPPEKRSCVENVDQPPDSSFPLANTYDDSSDDEIGDLGGNFFVPEEKDEYRDFTGVCRNPFKSLNLKENPGLYAELKLFAEKTIPYCNAILKTSLCFEGFEEVTSCHSDCSHHLLRIKFKDECGKSCVVVYRGRLRSGGNFAVADLQDFLLLSVHEQQ